MKFIKNNLIFLLPILSGILLILAYPPYNLEFLVWVALIPLLYFISLKSVSLKKAFIGGTLCGIIFFGKLFGWLFATAPFEWMGIVTKQNTILIFVFLIILYIIQTVFLSLFIGAFCWAVKKFWKSNIVYLLIIPAFWIVFEYLRAWGFGVLWLGKESLLGPHWTFGNLAYAIHNRISLIQIADIGGIYLISFLIVFVNTALFFILKNYKQKKLVINSIIILAIVGLIWSGYGIYKTSLNTSSEKEVEIALLQTNFLSGSESNSYQKSEVFKTVLDLFSIAVGDRDSDIIISPEGFGIVSLTESQEIAKHLLGDFWKPGQIYLENQKIVDKDGKTKSRLFYYDLEQEDPITIHDKLLLIPNGEFMPYLTKTFLSIYSFDTRYKQRLINKGEDIGPAFVPLRGTTARLGGTICSSILSPNINRQMTKKGAEFLVVVSSDAPFHGSKALLAQNLAMSKLRAVENRRYFAQSTNMGYSFLLYPNGKIAKKSSELGNAILFSNIKLNNKKTIYTKFGDWIIILAIIILVVFTKLCFVRNRVS